MNRWRVMGYDTFAREPYCVDLNVGWVTVLWSAPLSVRVRSRRIRRLRQPQNEHLKPSWPLYRRPPPMMKMGADYAKTGTERHLIVVVALFQWF